MAVQKWGGEQEGFVKYLGWGMWAVKQTSPLDSRHFLFVIIFFHQNIFPKTRKCCAIFIVVSMDEVTAGGAAQAINVQVCLILLFTWRIYFDVAYITFSSEFSKYETGKVGKF